MNNENAMIVALFEEIKQTLKKIDENIRKQFTTNSQEPSKLLENEIGLIRNMLEEKLTDIEDNREEPKQQVIKHRHTIDIQSSWVSITLVVLIVFSFISVYFHIKQNQLNDQLVNNDLKYRYIKMKGGVVENDILWLENIFEYNYTPEIVRKISKEVKAYEQRLQEQARLLEEARLKEMEAKRLKEEAELLNSK